MAVQVEHDKRKQEILEKSLDLFVEEGYEDVTFQKIADRCGITRTTLYIYFKNKREIFLWSIKQFSSKVEKDILKIVENEKINSCEALSKMFDIIYDYCNKEDKLFKVLAQYLMQLQKTGADDEKRVHRRIIRFQHLMSTVVIRGQKNGELKKLPVKSINEMFYRIVASGLYSIAVLGKNELEKTKDTINFAIEILQL